MVLADGVAPPPTPAVTTTPAPVFAPVATPGPSSTVPTPEQLYAAKEIGEVGTVTATAALYDPALLADGGCDPAGCTADLTRVRRPRGTRTPSHVDRTHPPWFGLSRRMSTFTWKLRRGNADRLQGMRCW